MTKRFILAPGPVWSRTDGQRHHVTAGQLARLYGVRLDECLIFRRGGGRRYEGLPVLGPRDDGVYRLPDPPPPTPADVAAWHLREAAGYRQRAQNSRDFAATYEKSGRGDMTASAERQRRVAEAADVLAAQHEAFAAACQAIAP